jgi:hypothetical protein
MHKLMCIVLSAVVIALCRAIRVVCLHDESMIAIGVEGADQGEEEPSHHHVAPGMSLPHEPSHSRQCRCLDGISSRTHEGLLPLDCHHPARYSGVDQGTLFMSSTPQLDFAQSRQQKPIPIAAQGKEVMRSHCAHALVLRIADIAASVTVSSFNCSSIRKHNQRYASATILDEQRPTSRQSKCSTPKTISLYQHYGIRASWAQCDHKFAAGRELVVPSSNSLGPVRRRCSGRCWEM